ncbi:hypothetical protein SMD22_00355 (plasmid) [Brevibacillus halotolerans]|nr:hypothetical protein SMD22_00355 [Brevibacillus halotolerans]
MRSAEETLILFKQALERRKAYVRRQLKKLNEAETQYATENRKGNRGRAPEKYKGLISLRGGMLSEHATIAGLLTEIENENCHPDDLYNLEDDPVEPC